MCLCKTVYALNNVKIIILFIICIVMPFYYVHKHKDESMQICHVHKFG